MKDPGGGSLRPRVRFLEDPLIGRILSEARTLLRERGVEIANDNVTDLLLSAGARRDKATGRILIHGDLIDAGLASAPDRVTLHDRDGAACAELGGDRVHFTPGSAAINILDGATGEIRSPVTADYVRYARLVDRLEAIDYQSTALIPSDVPESISDSYRLYLSLIYGTTPVVTGAFTVEGLDVMLDLLEAVRGGPEALAGAPLAIFTCCATAPLKWSRTTSQNLIDCARRGVPAEILSVPLTGFIAPGTLVGTLVQLAAENLSGLVISQTAAPGAPVLWGGSPAVFDYRFETTPVGAIETQMLDCACAEIGKHLGLPTQAYITLSDAKCLDAQAGMETASGAVLAALAGINSVSGPGMLDFESCQSLEKLVLDNEICATARRLVQGIEPREGDFPAARHHDELLREGHLLIADHTRRWIDQEVRLPGEVIDRVHRARYLEQGGMLLRERARREIGSLLADPPKLIDSRRRAALDDVMRRAAGEAGMKRLPDHEI